MGEQLQCFQGFLNFDGALVRVEFEAPVGASKEQKDAAFLDALGEVVRFDYLPVGLRCSQRGVEEGVLG